MSFVKPKFLLLVLSALLLPALWMSGCSGSTFTASNDATAGSGASSSGGSSGHGSAGKGGMVGTGAGTGVKCAGPEDCDDKDACTSDLCNADGTCDASPKCSGTEQCCPGGDCQTCCSDADCDDGVSCTANQCFSGQCMYVPDDTKCDASQYCSTKDGCRARQTCGILATEPADVCSDDSACTVDSCEKNLCQHAFCPDPEAKLCCEGVGCAACCNDSQCNMGNPDPCKVGSCTDGKCSVVSLCKDGDECCPSADGKTATCGKCCSAAECDDHVGCTKDSCGGGQCSHTPGACMAGQVCDLKDGCQRAPDCTTSNECKPVGCQTNPKCDNGACHFDGCASNKKCCAGTGGGAAGCAVCCGDAECTDGVDCTTDTCTASGCTHTPDKTKCAMGQLCDAQAGCVACQKATDCDDGLSCTTDSCSQGTCSHISTCGMLSYCTDNGCSECKTDSDCQGGGVLMPNVARPPIGVGCNVSTCVQGKCQTKTEDCGDFQVCCQPYGCQLHCGIETQ